MRPILTFLSDFGLADSYVAAVKGVVLSFCPETTIVDVTHQVPAHDVFEGAMLLRDAYANFPEGTVHLAVVDPGVGTDRPALLVRTARYIFAGPDNGLLSPALAREKDVRPYHIKPTWPVLSNTFHGRDVFAPAAGRLLAGDEGSSFLVPVESYQKLDVAVPKQLEPRSGEIERWQGAVLRVDTFGNLITNLSRERFGPLLERYAFELSVPGGPSLTQLAPNFEAAPRGAPVVIWGSSGALEICIRQYSAAQVLGVHEPGAEFEIAFLKGDRT